MSFPTKFVWGVASAAYQIEGAAKSHGRGLSIWDEFCDTPGKVFDGHSGETACDAYHRVDEDVSLMSRLGTNGYRFSISWSRLFPDGIGVPNEQGFAYYDRLINALLDRGIEPWITLYHWDLPLALHEQGGWLNSRCPEWFEAYTRAVVERYSDRVTHWFTLNEPQIFLGHGYKDGKDAPGLQLSRKEVLLATHHALLAHGRAVKIIRQHAKTTPVIGFAPVGGLHTPESDSLEDLNAAREATFLINEQDWAFNYAWYCDPVFLGHYPEQGLELFGDDVPQYTREDMELINQPLDMCGVNIYTAGIVRAGDDGKPEAVPSVTGYPMTMFKWTINPQSLYFGPKFLQERYGLPIVITENGLASMDWVHADGKIHDAGRIDYLTKYLTELRRACADGVDIRGYFQWSIMDNFEWGQGYSQRFGLIYIDYQTLERTPKDSFEWYRRVIETNGEQFLFVE